MSDDPEDTELFERLRAHDPAASLPPAEPARVARLLEDAMSHDLDTPARRRTALTWLVAAAALLVIAGVGVFAVVGGDDEPQVPTAQEPAPTVVELSARPPVAAKCAVPTAELLGNQETAFDGTVSAIADGTVTLDVTEWYRGRSRRPGHRRRTAHGHAGAGAGGGLPDRPALPRLRERRFRHGVRLHRAVLRRPGRPLRRGVRRALAWHE